MQQFEFNMATIRRIRAPKRSPKANR